MRDIPHEKSIEKTTKRLLAQITIANKMRTLWQFNRL